jgi:acyl carrier protein
MRRGSREWYTLASRREMETKDRVRQFIIKYFYVADLTALGDESSLLDQAIIDSTGVLEVIGYLEKEFSITVEDAEMLPENLDSIGRIARFVERKRGGAR